MPKLILCTVEHSVSQTLYFVLQLPAPGYYRFLYNLTIEISDPILVIGGVEECFCNGHSDMCNIFSGECQVRLLKKLH